MLVLNGCEFNDAFKDKNGDLVEYVGVMLVVKENGRSTPYGLKLSKTILDKSGLKVSDLKGKSIEILYGYNSFRQQYNIKEIKVADAKFDLK